MRLLKIQHNEQSQQIVAEADFTGPIKGRVQTLRGAAGEIWVGAVRAVMRPVRSRGAIAG